MLLCCIAPCFNFPMLFQVVRVSGALARFGGIEGITLKFASAEEKQERFLTKLKDTRCDMRHTHVATAITLNPCK